MGILNLYACIGDHAQENEYLIKTVNNSISIWDLQKYVNSISADISLNAGII